MQTETITAEKSIFDSFDLDETTELLSLVRSIEFADDFSLLFARCNQRPSQKKLIERISEQLPALNIETVYLGERVENLLEYLRGILKDKKPDAIFIYGLEESFTTAANARNTPFVRNLNASRNSFPAVTNCPVVFFLPDFALNALMHGSPDFFSVRSGVFFFSSEGGETADKLSQTLSGDFYESQSLTFNERQNRITAVEELLSEYESLPEKERNTGIEIELKEKLGSLYYISADYSKAASLSEEILDYAIKNGDEILEATSYNNLAELYRTQGRYEKAEPYYDKALEIRRRVLGEDHPSTATSYNNLALLYKTQGRYEEAEPYYEKALEIRRSILGENHPNTAGSYNNLALLYDAQGRYEEAEPYYEKSLEIRRRILGEDHPSTAGSYMNLGAFYYERGRVREALELCEKALGIYRNALPAGHPDIQNCERGVETIKKALDG